MGRYVGTSLTFKTEFKNKRIYDSTGSFVASSVDGSDAVRITAIGPGANGSSSAGGAAGGWAQKTTFLKPGCAYCVTVGTTGTSTSFGSVITATAGSGQTTAGCGVGGDVNFCGGCGAGCVGYFQRCWDSCNCGFGLNSISVFGLGYGGYCLACCICCYCCMLTAASGGGAPSSFGNGCNAIAANTQPGLGSSQGGLNSICYGQCFGCNDGSQIYSCDDRLACCCILGFGDGYGGISCYCGSRAYTSCGFGQIFTCGPSNNPSFVCVDVTVPFTYVPFSPLGAGCAGSTTGNPTTISTCSREFIADKACPHQKCQLGGSLLAKGRLYYCCSTCTACGFCTNYCGNGRGESNCTLDPQILNTVCRYVPQSSAYFGAPLGASGGADVWYRCCSSGAGCTSEGNRAIASNILFGCCLGTTNGCYGSGAASGATHLWRTACGPGFNNTCNCTVCRTAGCGGAGLVIVEW
jgi:hypothetical protein